MIIKILGDWDYMPSSLGNKATVIKFRRLSGEEELSLRRAGEDGLAERRFVACIAQIKDPFTLEFPDGLKRPVEAADIPDTPELADLYYELVVAYADKSTMTPDAQKKTESDSTLF